MAKDFSSEVNGQKPTAPPTSEFTNARPDAKIPPKVHISQPLQAELHNT
jgi:hypothetical protein